MMPFKLLLRSLLISFFLVNIVGGAAFATTKPLLLEGKKTLFQRVVTRPGAQLSESAGSSRQAKPLPPFSIQYIYSKKQVGKKRWLQVAENIRGENLGWVPEDQLITWNQGLTVTFRNPLERERALLFKDRDSLKKLVDDQNSKQYQRYYKQAVNGIVTSDSPVVAIQPIYNIDAAKEFYVAPILQHEDVFFGNSQAKLLKIATIPDNIEPAKATDSSQAPAFKVPEGFSTGVVFVMDATLSMGPYINRTRAAIRKIYQQLDQTGGVGQLRIGLVAFRDNPEEVEGLEYLTKTFATLEQGVNAEQFFSVVDQVRPATVSSKDFREDAYAGIKTALETIDWKDIDARYVILVTDAGPRSAQDGLGSTGLSAAALNKLAEKQNISLTVLHLLTSAGVDNHEDAKQQYQTLSRFPGVGALYYGVAAGQVEEFGKAVDILSTQISQQVVTAMGGTPPDSTKDTQQLAGLADKISRVGNAMRMQYFSKDQQVPDVVSAWTLDRSFADPAKKTLDVGVLLTRDQLSDLHERLTKTLESFADGLLEPGNFISDIKSVAATLSRDPKQLQNSATGTDLASMGLLQEYIEDLPYQSAALSISLDDWESWPVSQQVHFVNKLEEKIAYYQALYDHTDMWYSPGGGSVNGDSVIALSLDMLP